MAANDMVQLDEEEWTMRKAVYRVSMYVRRLRGALSLRLGVLSSHSVCSCVRRTVMSGAMCGLAGREPTTFVVSEEVRACGLQAVYHHTVLVTCQRPYLAVLQITFQAMLPSKERFGNRVRCHQQASSSLLTFASAHTKRRRRHRYLQCTP